MSYVCSFFEHGDPLCATYFNVRKIKHGDVIYVVISDLPTFIERFQKLPADARIILVTGSEDIGAPYEIFHPNRPNFFVSFWY
jgi:hypothetical protein